MIYTYDIYDSCLVVSWESDTLAVPGVGSQDRRVEGTAALHAGCAHTSLTNCSEAKHQPDAEKEVIV